MPVPGPFEENVCGGEAGGAPFDFQILERRALREKGCVAWRQRLGVVRAKERRYLREDTSVMARGSTRQEGHALVVLLVLTAIAVPLVLSGIGVARGLSVGDRQSKGISYSQYAAMTADAMVAQTTDLLDGGPPMPSATLTWTDDDESFHYAHYAVVDGEVLREHDGLTTTVAKRVVAARFSRVGKTLIFAIDLESAGGVQTKRIEVFARSLQ